HCPIHSDSSNPTQLGLGSPIRTPTDHSLVDNSPWTIAASHVLHRPLVPRHPPYATFPCPLQITSCSRTLLPIQKTHQPPPTTRRPACAPDQYACTTSCRAAPNHTSCAHRPPTAPPPLTQPRRR